MCPVTRREEAVLVEERIEGGEDEETRLRSCVGRACEVALRPRQRLHTWPMREILVCGTTSS